MRTPALDHLSDHIERVRTASEDDPDCSSGMLRVDELTKRIVEREHSHPDLPSIQLRHAFRLSNSEQSVLWLLVAKHCAASRLSLDEIRRAIFGEHPGLSALDELGPRGTLRRYALIEMYGERGDGAADEGARWTVSRRVLSWLHGDEAIDPDLAGLAVCADAPVSIAGLAMAAASFVQAREQAVRNDEVLVVIAGPQASGRRSLARACVQASGSRALEIDTTRLAKNPGELEQQVRSIARECRLLRRTPVIRNIDALVDEKGQHRLDLLGCSLVSEIDGPVFVTCGVNRPAMRWDRPCVVIDVKPPANAQRAELWLRELGQGTQEDAEYLAAQYPLAPALIHHAANAAKARAADRKIEAEDIDAGIRGVLDDRLGNLAKRVEITQSWDDLVLPEEQQLQITYLIARIRQRGTVYEEWGFGAKVGKGLGVSALFSGPPGTGKTMVAALIAKELGIELYQVDRAKMVSKWIGETERNVAELFDAAEAGHAILLFDEADSLFGKRTDVKSSNDRYANLETNYLLQRLESFTGICLLTSNHESAIDPAFMRRLSLHLRFDVPDVAEREALWHAMIPRAAPVEPNVNVASLARRFEMTGGYIRNAALRAAFMAADEGSVITTAHLERAARFEYEAMGKIAA